jgi:hypothetical protein
MNIKKEDKEFNLEINFVLNSGFSISITPLISVAYYSKASFMCIINCF